MLDDLTTQLATLYARSKLDLRRVVSYVREGRGLELVRARMDAPSTVELELTNASAAAYMSDDTFAHLVTQLRDLRVHELRIGGGTSGDPTLHPKLAEYLYRLHRIAPAITAITNGQRLGERISRAALRVLDVLEVPVASDNAAGYARACGGADLNRLLGNLATLRSLRDRIGSHTTLRLRVLVQPAERAATIALMRFWARHGDVVQTEMQREAPDGDRFPACTAPSRTLAVAWNGDVPLCRSASGALLGNLHDTPLGELWHAPLIAQYRAGHRHRAAELMPLCRGCADAQRRRPDFVPLASLLRS